MKRIYLRLFSYLVLLIVVSVSVYGQSYRTFGSELAEIEQNARWRFGPFRIYASAQFRNVGYDNNIYQMSKEDDPIGDYTTTVSLPFTFYLPYRNWMIAYLDISPGYDFYLHEKQQNGLNYSYSPGVRFLFLNRFVLSGSHQQQKQKQRPTVEFDERIYVESDGYNASLFYETARMTAIGFTGSVRNIRYEDIEGDFSYSTALNHEQSTGNIEFYYRIFTESDFFLTAGYADYIFENPESQWRDSYSYEVISGIRFPLLGRARGILSLGYRWLVNKADQKSRFSGLIGDTRLDFRLNRFNLRFQFARDFQFSYQSTSLYFIGNRIGSGLSFYLTEFIRLDYDFSYGKTEYNEELIQSPDGGFEENIRMDTYLTHSAGLVFRIKRNIGIGLTATYWERDSNILGVRRTRGFIGGYLTYDF
ncbi:MAG: outer membrane beta-barrel protein [Candidatus Bathyarchaeia archaeon]